MDKLLTTKGKEGMKVEILGSGGAYTIPQPLCSCAVCEEAREKGVPYARTGPSVFVHGPNILIDTPEEAKLQINRSGITSIEACFYSHWHPDHVMGRRVWDMNKDPRGWPPDDQTTAIYVPERVAVDFKQHLATWEHLEFLQGQGLLSLTIVPEGESIRINEYDITPVNLAEEYVFAFLIEGAGRRLLIAPDELLAWRPPQTLGRIDLALLPMGVVEFNPLTGERKIHDEHPVLQMEATFKETLHIIKELKANRVILTHIEEPDHLSFDDLLLVEENLAAERLPVRFAYDGLVVEV